MECNGQLYVPAALGLGKVPTVPLNVGGEVGARADLNILQREEKAATHTAH
jgi:hypothetical protein